MLELIVAICILLSLILYALMGGADFGGGMWDLLAAGPRAARQRKAIAEAIGPIWEANHVWLILVVVLLFTGFPSGFTGMMTALNIPLTAMLIGIVLRGSAFIFRRYDSRSDAAQRRWSMVFGIASFFTPFFQGMILGALATGQIRIVNGQVVTGFFAGWLTPFALACGVFALGLFAFLAATYLTLDTKDQPDLQNDFRLRALWSGLTLAPIAGVVFLASKQGAPEMYHGLTHWWAPLLLGWTSLFAIGALVALWRRRFAAGADCRHRPGHAHPCGMVSGAVSSISSHRMLPWATLTPPRPRCACWSWHWVSAPSYCCHLWFSCSTFSRARKAVDEGNHFAIRIFSGGSNRVGEQWRQR